MKGAGGAAPPERSGHRLGLRCAVLLLSIAFGCAAAGQDAAPANARAAAELRHGRELLQQGKFAEAKRLFREEVKAGVGGVQAQLGLADAELGLHEYEAAEIGYRAVVAQQPELWQAHKNLVVVEAALGRWEEFDGERRILELARQRDAPGISARESDVIDTLNVNGEHWTVRAYFQPVGRSQTLYNFERFSPSGRVEAYISLEDAMAAQAALTPQDERVGGVAAPQTHPQEAVYALNWYTGAAHGTVVRFPAGQPSYERVRADVLRWLRTHPAALRSATH